MALAAGSKLAHYEIVEPIGKRGMGEGYTRSSAATSPSKLSRGFL